MGELISISYKLVGSGDFHAQVTSESPQSFAIMSRNSPLYVSSLAPRLLGAHRSFITLETIKAKGLGPKCVPQMFLGFSRGMCRSATAHGYFRVPKTLTFKMRPNLHDLSCENEFICMRMNNHFHVKGWILNLVLIVCVSFRSLQLYQ